MFQLKDGLLYSKPTAVSCAELFLLERGSRGAGIWVSVCFREVVEGAWPGVCVQAGLPGNWD